MSELVGRWEGKFIVAGCFLPLAWWVFWKILRCLNLRPQAVAFFTTTAWGAALRQGLRRMNLSIPDNTVNDDTAHLNGIVVDGGPTDRRTVPRTARRALDQQQCPCVSRGASRRPQVVLDEEIGAATWTSSPRIQSGVLTGAPPAAAGRCRHRSGDSID